MLINPSYSSMRVPKLMLLRLENCGAVLVSVAWTGPDCLLHPNQAGILLAHSLMLKAVALVMFVMLAILALYSEIVATACKVRASMRV